MDPIVAAAWIAAIGAVMAALFAASGVLLTVKAGFKTWSQTERSKSVNLNACYIVCAAGDAGRYVSAAREIDIASRRASIECHAACVDNARGWLKHCAS
jgi:Pyruvate/2-oxoacid:ferredoxin oxidoreductase gamma subunit